MVWRKTYDKFKSLFGWTDNNDWILTDRTQLESVSGGAQRQQLVIGLDFGTAYTKVVIGEPRVKYAVPFGQFAHRDNPYLVPSKIAIVGDSEECLIGSIDGVEKVIDDLKMRFLARDFGEESKVYMAAYIALILRYARGWLLDTHRRVYEGSEIEWLVNIGLPTASYDDEELTEAYEDAIQTAWAISALPGAITLSRVREYLYNIVVDPDKLPEAYANRFLDRELITCLPEFAVQLVGYVRSPRRQESLHILIDIGAGTFDITSFNVYRHRETGEDRFPIFENRVEKLGVRFLLSHREKGANKIDVCSPYEEIPPMREYARLANISTEQLDEIDQEFEGKIRELILDTMRYTKERRYQIYTQWENGVPTFYCGGGASVDFYKRLFVRFEKRNPPFKFVHVRLEKPDDLDAPRLPTNTYDRLSVAYGLSFDPFDIGEIMKKSEVEDETGAEGSGEIELCSRCNGTGGPMGGCIGCDGTGWILE